MRIVLNRRIELIESEQKSSEAECSGTRSFVRKNCRGTDDVFLITNDRSWYMWSSCAFEISMIGVPEGGKHLFIFPHQESFQISLGRNIIFT